MKKRNIFILIFLVLVSNACISQKKMLSQAEQRNINLFNDFVNYLANAVHKGEDIGDTAHLKYVSLHYLFVEKKLDSSDESTINDSEFTGEQLQSLRAALITFGDFIRGHKKDRLAENLTLIPIRLSTDTVIYKRLTRFQKENTFVFYDKRFPNKNLGYVLFIPPTKRIVRDARIWSWTLMFRFGKYFFKSVTGNEGHEYLFSPEVFKK